MIDTKPTEVWSYVAEEVNRIGAQVEELKRMMVEFHPPKRTKEELAELRRANLVKAREARAKK